MDTDYTDDTVWVDMAGDFAEATEIEAAGLDAMDAAIDMAKWDVRETLELTHAEFTCFVRDQWDWKSGFEAISQIYRAVG